MTITSRRVLVTGGAGFIGSHVVDRLVADGNSVVVVDDFSTGTRENLTQHADGDVEVREGDVRDLDLMREVSQGVDVVLHMAVASLRVCLNDPWSVHEINAGGTLQACRAAREAGVSRFVYCSSSEAYGSAVTAPMAEDHPLVPTTVYGASKAAGELYALAHWRTYGMPVVVVRPFNTYGPREHAEGTSAEVIPKFVHRALAGVPPIILGGGQQTRDFTWVEDSARGILAAAACDDLVGEAVNIARGEEVAIAHICDLVVERAGRPELKADYDSARPGDVDRHYADTTRAREVLGFVPEVSIAEGIDRYVTWVEKQDLDLGAWLERDRVQNW
jgi:UDP-glucose 4-epimerase